MFPKKDKHALGTKIEILIINVIELLLEAGSAQKNEKLTVIRRASVKFDTLKVFIRVAKDLKLLDNKQYVTLQTFLQGIGQQMGGWQKSLM